MVHRFYPSISGTSERVFFTQPTKGVEHHIVVPAVSFPPSDYIYQNGFSVHPVDIRCGFPGRLSVGPRVKSLFKKGMQIIKQEDINIIYGHNPQIFAIASLILKKTLPSMPFVYEPHSLLFTEYQRRVIERHPLIPSFLLKQYFKYIWNTERNVLENADRVVCQTESIKNALMVKYSIKENKSIIAYNGMPHIPDNFDYSKTRKKLKLPPNKKIAFYGGHLSKNNGLDKIISLIEYMGDVFFLVAGRGEFEQKLSNLEKRVPNFRFLGALEKDEFLKVVAVSNVLLFLREPDLTNNIFLALKVLDAMRLKKIILSSNLEIMLEVSRYYKNIVFTELKFEKITQNLRFALTKQDILKDSMNDGRNSIFEWETTRKVLSKMYNDLVA